MAIGDTIFLGIFNGVANIVKEFISGDTNAGVSQAEAAAAAAQNSYGGSMISRMDVQTIEFKQNASIITTNCLLIIKGKMKSTSSAFQVNTLNVASLSSGGSSLQDLSGVQISPETIYATEEPGYEVSITIPISNFTLSSSDFTLRLRLSKPQDAPACTFTVEEVYT